MERSSISDVYDMVKVVEDIKGDTKKPKQKSRQRQISGSVSIERSSISESYEASKEVEDIKQTLMGPLMFQPFVQANSSYL